MSTNGANTSSEEAGMSTCNGDTVVTMMDVLKEQQDFEDDANAVLGASDDKNCTYAKGYVKRQAVYACITCCPDAKTDASKRAGVCLACSLNCHENHDLIELYTKRNFRCDCGNPKFNSHPCQFTPNKSDLNYENKYNQNFCGIYCVCHRPYPDPETTEEEEMIQCIVCEDWLHEKHLEATLPYNDQYAEMVCKDCMEDNDFLHDYTELVINTVDKEIIETDPDLDVDITSIISTAKQDSTDKENLLNNSSRQVEPTESKSEETIKPTNGQAEETAHNEQNPQNADAAAVEKTKDEEQELPKENEKDINEQTADMKPSDAENAGNSDVIPTKETQSSVDSDEAANATKKIEDEVISKSDMKEDADIKEEKQEVSDTKEHKRKLSTEVSTDDITTKKPKLDTKPCVRPRGVKRVYKGATFWPANLRSKVCTCNECVSMYKDLGMLFLMDENDTVTAYEALGKENTEGPSSQYEKGLLALSSLDRVQQINALTEYNKMRDKLLDFLKSFKDKKEIVKEEDIKAFFAGMKPKREPDGVYFCR